MLKEKINQAKGILKEKKIDMWLTFGRESSNSYDPAADLIVGAPYTWTSAFIITAKGDTIAIVGSLDKANIKDTGLYKKVLPYVKSIKQPLLQTLRKLKPRKIAINTSKNDTMSDGLSHGMYQNLMSYLRGTPYSKRLVSAEPVIQALRGRKTPSELKRIKAAIDAAEKIFVKAGKFMKPGKTEAEVAQYMKKLVEAQGLEPAWDPSQCPAVFSGPDTAGAHAAPTKRRIAKGHVLNIDFGVKKDGYCSDLQRTWYFLRKGETKAPEVVIKAVNIIRDSIYNAAKNIRPGMEGWKVDDMVRSKIVEQGFDEYPHGLGHEIGRAAHDGSGLFPKWERYGKQPYNKVEEGQVYTLEPRITIPGYGVATLEEIVVVTKNGGKFLSNRQKELFYIR